MNARLAELTLSLALCAFGGATTARAQRIVQDAEPPLTNASVVKLVRARFSEKVVIAIIRSRPTRFDLAPDRLIELKKNGVSEKIILAMLALDGSSELAEDSWDDDDFFRDGDSRGGPQKNSGSDPGGVNIFGSSDGSRGRTRSRAGGGGNESNTQATGSATV
ncbi:MAG: hypothetical protein ACRD68_03680, partial [Pyrinomonadaceae bacterium]